MEKKRILIVDDEASFARVVKSSLEETGEFEVKIETRGVKAFATAWDFIPDLILLDIFMPDLDGSEVAKRLRRDEKLRNIPVVFLTATVGDDEVLKRGGMIGGHPFLTKPVVKKDLMDCINENLTVGKSVKRTKKKRHS